MDLFLLRAKVPLLVSGAVSGLVAWWCCFSVILFVFGVDVGDGLVICCGFDLELFYGFSDCRFSHELDIL